MKSEIRKNWRKNFSGNVIHSFAFFFTFCWKIFSGIIAKSDQNIQHSVGGGGGVGGKIFQCRW